MMQDKSNNVVSLDRYIQELNLNGFKKGKLIDQYIDNSLESGYGSTDGGLYDSGEMHEFKKPLDFSLQRLSCTNVDDRYEVFGALDSTTPLLPRCYSSSLQEISDDSSRSCNLLPRPATAGSINDFHRLENPLENCLSDTGLSRSKYRDSYLLDQTYRYLDAIKANSWTDNHTPPPGLSSPPPTSTLWDDGFLSPSENCCASSIGCWTQSKSTPQIPSFHRQPVNRKFECRPDYMLQNASFNNINRPLRSQRVDIRILYGMMYRALANGIAGGRREVCVFCRNNGEHELIYTSHSLKDSRNKVTCPILRAYQCPICLSTGDKAHTIKYCPYNTDSNITQDTPLEKLFRYVHNQHQTMQPISTMYSRDDQPPVFQNNNLQANSQEPLGVTDLLVNLLQSNTYNGSLDHNGSPLINAPPRSFR